MTKRAMKKGILLTCLIMLVASCNHMDTYEIPSNLGRMYKVQPERDGLSVYNENGFIAHIDTTIQLTHLIELDGRTYLVEEGPEVTAFYDLKGKQTDSFVGHILYAEADAVLLSGRLHDYDSTGQVYSYLYLSKIGYGGRIDNLSCVEMANYAGREYVYTVKLGGKERIYDLALTPISDPPLDTSPSCDSNQ